MTTQNQETAITLRTKAEVEACLSEAIPEIMALLPGGFTPERMIKIFVHATDKNPELLKCSRKSWQLAFIDAAESGLEPVGFTGEAALVPYGGQVQFQPMYKGLCKKVRECAGVQDIHAETVCQGDEFEFYHATPEDHLFHRPAIMNRGEVVGAWARAILADGKPKILFYDTKEIERCRKASKAPSGPMWGQHYGEAAKKSVIKALCKTLPMTPSLAKVIEMDNRVDSDINNATAIPRPTPLRRSEITTMNQVPPPAQEPAGDDIAKPCDLCAANPWKCEVCGGVARFFKSREKGGRNLPAFYGCEHYKDKAHKESKKAHTQKAADWHATLSSQLSTEFPAVVSGGPGLSPCPGPPFPDEFIDRIVVTAEAKGVNIEQLGHYIRREDATKEVIERRIRELQNMTPEELQVCLKGVST